MDLNRKKVLLIPLDNALTAGGGLTDFHVRRAVLDRIRQLNISHVVIIVGESDDKDFNSKVKAIQFFVFAYCKIAVGTNKRSNGLIGEVMEHLPHSMRKKECFVSVGEKITGVDYISLEDFA